MPKDNNVPVGKLFNGVKKEKLSNVDLVIERIKTLLIERKLKPGDLLPSENVLSESIGISRGTIRRYSSSGVPSSWLYMPNCG